MSDQFLQKLFINILNPIYSITGRVSERAREAIIQVLWYVIFACFIFFRSAYIKGSFLESLFPTRSIRYLFCTMVLLVIGILSIKAPLKQVPWRKIIFILQLVLGIGIIVISYVHPVGDGYRLLGFQLLLVFPCIYFIWNNRKDYDNIFKPVVTAMTSCGMILYLITILFAINGDLMMEGVNRCKGIMINANCFSLVGLEMIIGAIYFLITEQKSISKAIYNGISLGAGIGIILLGQMRIAIILIIICIPVAIFYYLKYLNGKCNRRAAGLFLITVLVMSALIVFSDSITEINKDAIERKQSYLSGEKTQEEPKAQIDELAEDNKETIVDRLTPKEGGTLDGYSSGRIRIWNNYAKDLNWFGNNYDNYDPVKMTVPPNAQYAHNIFLEVAYRFGIPIGVLMVLYCFVCGVICLRYLFFDAKNGHPYKLFVIMCMIVFTLESILDCAGLPFFQAEALLFYLSIMVITDSRV